MRTGKTFNVGDRVRIDPTELERFYVTAQKKFRDRDGVIDHVFTPLGCTSPAYRVKWCKKGNRGKEFYEYHQSRDLEAIA